MAKRLAAMSRFVITVVTRCAMAVPALGMAWRHKARWWRRCVHHMRWRRIDYAGPRRVIDHTRWWGWRRYIHGHARYIDAYGNANVTGMRLGTCKGYQQAHGSQAARAKASTESGLVHVSVSSKNCVRLT